MPRFYQKEPGKVVWACLCVSVSMGVSCLIGFLCDSRHRLLGTCLTTACVFPSLD